MKISTSIYLSLILSVTLAANAEAAKENYDRSKVRTSNSVDNDCNSKTSKIRCEPQALSAKLVCNPATSAQCPKHSGHVTPLKARMDNGDQSGGTRATDYNSSRSNRTTSSSINSTGGGDDLILRKRPGRTMVKPAENCPQAKKGEKTQTKPNCPAEQR